MSTTNDPEVGAEEREAFLRTLDDAPIVSDDAADPVRRDLYLDRLLARLAEIEGDAARNRAIAQEQTAHIDRWLQGANGTLERQAEWLRQGIEAAAQGYDFGRKRSRDLPHGRFGYRRSPERLEILDMEAAAIFAEANGLPVKRSVDKAPLREWAQHTGEVPPGTEIVPGAEKFYVTPTGGA